MSLPTTLIHITVPNELLPKIDQVATRLYVGRNEFLHQAIMEKLRREDAAAFPNENGINILMTDKQLLETRAILQQEIWRRQGQRPETIRELRSQLY